MTSRGVSPSGRTGPPYTLVECSRCSCEDSRRWKNTSHVSVHVLFRGVMARKFDVGKPNL